MGTRRGDSDGLARALGWFSLGLGAAQVGAPGAVNRLIGVRDDRLRRAVQVGPGGLRELAAGVGILCRPRSAGWLWFRVGGDIADLSMLAAALRSPRNERRRVAAALAAVAAVTALDVVAGRRYSRSTPDGTIHARSAITVQRPVPEVYRFWRDVENLPRFMTHLQSVRTLGDGRSRWQAHGPAGTAIEWDAEIIEDTADTDIAWRSLSGAQVENSGRVRFAPAPGGRGTEVSVEIEYRQPGGKLGKAVAAFYGEEPRQQLHDDLRRLKQVLETGVVVRSGGSPEGTHSGRQLRQRPARPVATAEKGTR